jgi:hypothetical protein
MNSLFWTKFHRGENCTNLYREICKLAVLSGTEIDKAKRDYGIDASDVLEGVKEQINIGKQRPSFMKVVRKKELTEKDIQKLRKSGVLYSDDFDTAMQTLQYVVSKLSEQETKSYKEKKRVGISTLLCGLEDKKLTNEYDYKNEIISKALLENPALELWRKDATFQTDQTEKKFCWDKCNEIEQRVLEFVKKKMKNEYVLNLLIKELDDPSSSVQSVKSLLLSCICSANHSLLDQVMITGQRNSRSVISMDDDGDIEIFGIKHRTELV